MASNDFTPTPPTNDKENGYLQQTAVSQPDDRSSQPPPFPVIQHKFGSPTPLGLIAFASNMFLISMYGLQASGVQNPNVMVGMLVFFGGMVQIIAGIMEFVVGNTFGATVFSSYGAFNISYGMVYLPTSGIMAAYTDPSTGAMSPEFNQAVAIYMWVWFIVSCIFTVATIKSTWVLFLDLIMVDICLLLLACGFMVGIQSLLTAGYAFGLVVTFLTYWAGCVAMWSNTTTPVRLPAFEMGGSAV